MSKAPTQRHTAAPWHVVVTENCVVEVCGEDGKPIGTVSRYRNSEEELANAALIAASPALLDVLKKVQQRCFFDDEDGQIGVSEDVVIESALFDEICTVLKLAEPQS